jgi:polar amino acid transport system substrate-binding protein
MRAPSGGLIKKSALLAAVLFLSLGVMSYGETFKAAVMELPVTQAFSALANAIAEATNNTVALQVVPPPRTVYLIENKLVDFTLPMLAMKDPAKIKALTYDYSSAVMYKSAFVLFTNKAKPVDIEDLKKGNTKGYKIETDISMVNQLEFTGIPSTSIVGSLRKVDAGTIDGFIHTEASTDAVLKALKLPSLKRQFYEQFDLVFPIQKGGRGGKVDAMLTAGLEKLKKSGRFDQIMGDLVKADLYNDWQP